MNEEHTIRIKELAGGKYLVRFDDEDPLEVASVDELVALEVERATAWAEENGVVATMAVHYWKRGDQPLWWESA